MTLITSPHETSEVRVVRQTGGRCLMRQGTAIISLTRSEVEQLKVVLDRETTYQYSKSRVHLPPVHPGKYLEQELKHYHLSSGEFASLSGCTLWEVQAVLLGEVGITVPLADRIDKVFRHRSEHLIDGTLGWLHLQNAYDLTMLYAHNSEALIAQEVK